MAIFEAKAVGRSSKRSGARAWRAALFGAAMAGAATAGASSARAQVSPGGPGAPGGVMPPGGNAAEQLQRDLRYQQLEQYELDTRLRADQAIPPDERLFVDYGAYVNVDYLSVDDRDRNNHGLREYDLFPYFRANLDGAQEVFVRTRIAYQDFNHGDNFNDPSKDYRLENFDLDRGYYRIDLRRYNQAYGTNVLGAGADGNLVFEGGRDLVYWANGLVLAEVLDGVFIDLSHGPLDLQVIAGVTPVRTVDFDTSRPAFYYNTRRGFFGGMLSSQIGEFKPYVYGVVERDFNSDNELVQGPIDTRYSYNTFYIGTGASGAIGDHFRYGIEGAYEGGNTLSNSFIEGSAGGLIPTAQTRDPVKAGAGDVRLDYLFNDEHKSRVEVEGIIASGNSNRINSSNTFGGSAPHTVDYGFNAFGLLNTGLAFAPEVSNLLVLRAGGSTFPLPDSRAFRQLQVGGDFFVLGKLQRDAPIDEPTGENRYLGVEPDVYLNWQITSDVIVAARYGLFVPSSKNFANDAARQFLYLSVTYGF